uniref:PRA1 family protein n=1 Tax=Kalanchoe fedtschenkoi TaxID=63787 RepID=A0A7N0ZUP5_KALFE
MASSAATLPISDQQPVATPAFRVFLSRLSSSVRQGFARRRPWLEMVDRTAMSRPENLSEAISRIRRNYAYFRVNYITLLAAVLAVSLLSNPFSLLLLLGLLGGWLFLYFFRPSDQPLVVLGRTFSEWETLGGLVVLTIVVVFLTSVGSLLISALLVGVAIASVHGAFRVPEDLFLDEQESSSAGPGAGFLTSLVGVPGPPPVATRV